MAYLSSTLISLLVLGTAFDLGAVADISRWPKDTVGIKGEQTILHCTGSLENQILQWYYKQIGSNDKIEIYRANPMEGNFITDEHKRLYAIVEGSSHDLIIRDTQFDSAGEYICLVTKDDLSSEEIAANLMVTDEVNCPEYTFDLVEDSQVDLICSVSYQGSQAPELSWKMNGTLVDGYYKVEESPVTTPKPPLTEGKKIEYVHNFTVTHVHHRLPFTCSVSFHLPDREVEGETCETVEDVLYGATDITITPDGSAEDDGVARVSVGDEIVCHALGNPAVTYIWQRVEGDGTEFFDTAAFRLNGDMLGLNTYNCTATNRPQGQDRSARASVRFYVDYTSAATKGIICLPLMLLLTACSLWWQ